MFLEINTEKVQFYIAVEKERSRYAVDKAGEMIPVGPNDVEVIGMNDTAPTSDRGQGQPNQVAASTGSFNQRRQRRGRGVSAPELAPTSELARTEAQVPAPPPRLVRE